MDKTKLTEFLILQDTMSINTFAIIFGCLQLVNIKERCINFHFNLAK